MENAEREGEGSTRREKGTKYHLSCLTILIKLNYVLKRLLKFKITNIINAGQNRRRGRTGWYEQGLYYKRERRVSATGIDKDTRSVGVL